MKEQVRSLKPYRLTDDNPEEVRFFAASELLLGSEPNKPTAFLRYLMDPSGSNYPDPVSQRDVDVASTILQWLGSPVGQSWLQDLGYKKTE